MNKIKKTMRKWARMIVTYYYNRLYRQAVELAEKRHNEEHTTIYVIDHFVVGQVLSCINRKEFRFIKHSAQKLHKNPMYYSNAYGTDMLRGQCWYHTKDGSEKNGLTDKDKEIRRLAFIRSGLKKAKLV